VFQVMILRCRFIVPTCYTGTYQLGVIQHLFFQCTYNAWLLMSLNRLDCENMMQIPVLAQMLNMMANGLNANPLLTYIIPKTGAVMLSDIGISNNFSAMGICSISRAWLQLFMMSFTSAFVYFNEIRARSEYSKNLHEPADVKKFLRQFWLLHFVTFATISVTSLGLIAVLAPFLESIPAYQSLLFQWSEVAGSSCAV
jgi:hypothetical protein